MKKVSLLLFCLLIISYFTIDVNGSYKNYVGDYLAFAEKMPTPIGGLPAIYKNITEYPKFAKSAGIEGKVYLLAYIDENGKVNDVKVVRGIGGGCDEVATDAVKKTKFNPGQLKGQPVKVKMSLQVVFKIQK